jgi:hypothetical protein
MKLHHKVILGMFLGANAFSQESGESRPNLKKLVQATRAAVREEVKFEGASDALISEFSKKPESEKWNKLLTQALESHQSYWTYVMRFNADRDSNKFSGEDKGNYYLTETYMDHIVNLPKSKLSLIEAFTGLHAIPGKVTDTPWLVVKLDVSNSIEGWYQDLVGGDLRIERSGNKLTATLSVVRGPTAHTGDIEGSLTEFGTNKYKLDVKNSDGKICSLLMSKNSLNHLSVKTADYEACQEFHGARAQFDGTFYKVPKSWYKE